jgi:hypothetical protein
MTIAGVFGKRCAIPCAQHRLAAVFDERHFTLEHIDELVFVAVPVALAGPAAGRQGHQIHAEIAKPARLAESPARTFCTGRSERWRITRTFARGDGGDVNLGHELLPRYVLAN